MVPKRIVVHLSSNLHDLFIVLNGSETSNVATSKLATITHISKQFQVRGIPRFRFLDGENNKHKCVHANKLQKFFSDHGDI